MAADAAIKELLKEELKEIREEQEKQDKRVAELEKACQELSSKAGDREREADKFREAFDKFKEDLETANNNAKALVSEDTTTMKARLDKFEDDTEGIGGIKQAHERWKNIEQQLNDFSPKLDDSVRLVKETTTRTDEFDRKLRDLTRWCDDATEALKASEQRVSTVEGTNSTVTVAQQALEDSVTRKYETLWKDVLHAIEEVKGGQLDVMKEDLENAREAAKSETKSLVNYALNMMASAHGERRQSAINKSLVLAWKEQTWMSARRRMGITYLHKVMLHRQRSVFDTWHRRHDTSKLCGTLKDQYTGQLEDVYKDIEARSNGLQQHCKNLDGAVTVLEKEKASEKSLKNSVQQLRDKLEDDMKALIPMNETLTEHSETLQRHDEMHRGHTDCEATLSQQTTGIAEDLAKLRDDAETFAKSEEVKGMIRDILLIWNSIKQLDTAKADKKDVDSMALETGNRDKLSARRLEDLETDLGTRSRQETLRMQEKWTELDGKMDESARQFRHWEQMWEKLSGFVEDLVGKISDLQANNNGDRLPSTTLRRPGSRDNLVRSRADIPTIPRNHENGYGGDEGDPSARTTARSQPRGVESLETKMQWLNSAKGIVDATIDQAVTPTTARPHKRPGKRPDSAPGTRRPHDRTK